MNPPQNNEQKKGILKTIWPTVKFIITAGIFGLVINLAYQHWSDRKDTIQDIQPWVGEWHDPEKGIELKIERESAKLIVRSIEAVNADLKPNKIYKNADNSCIIECTIIESEQAIKLYLDRPGGGGIKYTWGNTTGRGEGVFIHK